MTSGTAIAVIIPARDEAESIAGVLGRIPSGPFTTVIVADNRSRDRTAALARAAGATVLSVPRIGYGHACHAGMMAAIGCEIAVFLDGDGSMAPEEIPHLVAPITAGTADIVCGARRIDRGLMPAHQRAGNAIIRLLLRRLHGVRLSELGPFRAVRMSSLSGVDLRPSRFAWPAQLLTRAAASGARIAERPVSYAARSGGRSKVGGSLRGSLRAGGEIIGVLLWERVRRPVRSGPAQRAVAVGADSDQADHHHDTDADQPRDEHRQPDTPQ